MKFSRSQKLTPTEKMDIFHIWNNAYPAQIAYTSVDDFDTYLHTYANPTHLLAKVNSKVVGWLSTFDRNGERWFALLIDSHYQKKGVGSKLMHEMQHVETAISGWMVPHNDYIKSDGSHYLSPQLFYKKFGFLTTNETMQSATLTTVKIRWSK